MARIPMYRYTAFISHEGEEKRTVVATLLDRLHDRNLKQDVFYDRHMVVGGNANGTLRSKIKEGLENSKTLIVFLTPKFLCKPHPMYELTEFLSLMKEDSSKVLLPVFYRVSAKEVGDLAKDNAMEGNLRRILEVHDADMKLVKDAMKRVKAIPAIDAHGRDLLDSEVVNHILQDVFGISVGVSNSRNGLLSDLEIENQRKKEWIMAAMPAEVTPPLVHVGSLGKNRSYGLTLTFQSEKDFRKVFTKSLREKGLMLGESRSATNEDVTNAITLSYFQAAQIEKVSLPIAEVCLEKDGATHTVREIFKSEADFRKVLTRAIQDPTSTSYDFKLSRAPAPVPRTGSNPKTSSVEEKPRKLQPRERLAAAKKRAEEEAVNAKIAEMEEQLARYSLNLMMGNDGPLPGGSYKH